MAVKSDKNLPFHSSNGTHLDARSSAFLMLSPLSFDRIIRLRFQSMCKEYHRHKLVKNAFHHWQIRLMNRRADRRYSSVLQRFVTDLIV